MEQLARSMGVGLHTKLFESAQRLHHLYRQATSASERVSVNSDLPAAAACLFLASEQEECVLDINALAAQAGTRSLTSVLEAIVACIGETAGLMGLSQACTILAWERLYEPLTRLRAHAVAAAPTALRAQLAASSPVAIAGLLLAVVKTLGLSPRLVGIVCARLHANKQQSQRCAELISPLIASQLKALREDEELVEHLRSQRIKQPKSREMRPMSAEGEDSGQSTGDPLMVCSTSQSHAHARPCRLDYVNIHASHGLGYTWMVETTTRTLFDRGSVREMDQN